MRPELSHFVLRDRAIAYRLRDGADPVLVFLPGYGSDMEGAKAVALDAFAERRELAMLRFDYAGTGASSGRFDEGTLESWCEEALAAVDLLDTRPVILVGSSMGAWLACHVGLRRRERVQAVVGIAAALDFTEWGFADANEELRSTGGLEQASSNRPEPIQFAGAFIQSGQKLRLLDHEIGLDCAVRLIHGEHDEEVPVEIAFRTMRALRSGDVQLTVIKEGGHRLSRPHEIDAILGILANLLEPAS